MTKPPRGSRIAATLGSAALLLAAIAPLLLQSGRAEAAALYLGFAPVCHQTPERCVKLAGAPMAVCVRCLGFYGGLLLGAAFVPRRPIALLFAAASVAGLSAALELAAAWPWAGTAAVRGLTGAGLGCAVAGALGRASKGP